MVLQCDDISHSGSTIHVSCLRDAASNRLNSRHLSCKNDLKGTTLDEYQSRTGRGQALSLKIGLEVLYLSFYNSLLSDHIFQLAIIDRVL